MSKVSNETKLYAWHESDWRYDLQNLTLPKILVEADRAAEKHGMTSTPSNPSMLDEAKLVILIEEVGEVARAMTYDEGDLDNLKKELLQVAAMAAMWASSLDY